ncbi:hypothetical protein ACW9I7_33960, partial [Pseudomonas gingeri]
IGVSTQLSRLPPIPCGSWLASEDGLTSAASLKVLIAGKPAPTEIGVSTQLSRLPPIPCGSWLASEDGLTSAASLKVLIAGKPAPT